MLSAFLLILFLAAPALFAQGRGVAEGRLVNGTNPSAVPSGVELDVIGFAGGMSILKSATSDSAGRFRIEGLPTDTPMMIRANYKSVNYHGRVEFDSAGKASVEIQVYEPTTSMNEIGVEGARIAFRLVGEHLQSLESYSINNKAAPPRSYMNPEGNFRFSKAAGIEEVPRLSATGPDSSMPIVQSPLESPDGSSYYTLYPLRPGLTTFEFEQVLPYHDGRYVYRKKFYHDIGSVQIGVIPHDMTLTGEGLQKVQTDHERNFVVYSGGPVKAGEEVVWTFSGGTPAEEHDHSETGAGGMRVEKMPGSVGRNALVLGPLMLMGLMAVLWYAYGTLSRPGTGTDSRTRELGARRDQLLNYLATLDSRFENNAIQEQEYRRQREMGKRQLRRVAMLLGRE